VQTIENVVAGPLIAILSFVCSMATCRWRGAVVGRDQLRRVVAFIFPTFVVLPIVLSYRKYYGTAFALRITALMLVTIVLAALAVDGLFSLAGIHPRRPRPTAPTSSDDLGRLQALPQRRRHRDLRLAGLAQPGRRRFRTPARTPLGTPGTPGREHSPA